MEKFDTVISDLVKIYEKYDLFWKPGYNPWARDAFVDYGSYSTGFDIDIDIVDGEIAIDGIGPDKDCEHTERWYGESGVAHDPWHQSDEGDFGRWDFTSILNTNPNVMIELLDNNREIFKDYVCPYSKLIDVVEGKQLSENAKEELSQLIKRCIDTERERKLWIHNYLKTNLEAKSLRVGIKQLKIYRDNPEKKDLSFSKDGLNELRDKIKSDYYDKFPNVMPNYPTKELVNFAQGNKKYYLWDDFLTEEHDKSRSDGFFDQEFIFLMIPPEETIKNVNKQSKADEVKLEDEMKDLEKESRRDSSDGFFKRLLSSVA
ncbi:MAG: hypothetical protein H8D95_01315 [Candidatus Endolissoclinum sp.]|nr:hypothetical protein [Candidatus Endolissoclinum sp.]